MAVNLIDNEEIHVNQDGSDITLEIQADALKNEDVVVGSIRSKNMFDIQTMYSASTGGANTDITPSNNAKITSITNSSVSFTTSANWNGIACNYIKVEPSTDYILSFQTTSTTNEMFVKVCFYDSSKTFISDTYATGNLNFSITTTSTTKYVKVIIEKINSSSSAITLSNIQLEEGDTATAFSPFQNLTGKENYSIDTYTSNGIIIKFEKIGRVVVCTFEGSNTSALTADTNYSITINEKYTPTNNVRNCIVFNEPGVIGYVYIPVGTTLQYRVKSNLSANQYPRFSFTYISKD